MADNSHVNELPLTETLYSNSNLYQYIRSGDVSNTYSTIVNLQSTGQTLDNKINASELVAGNYFIKVSSEDKSYTTNLIIQ